MKSKSKLEYLIFNPITNKGSSKRREYNDLKHLFFSSPVPKFILAVDEDKAMGYVKILPVNFVHLEPFTDPLPIKSFMFNYGLTFND